MIDIKKLYAEWRRTLGEDKINLKFPSLLGLHQWFLRECKLKGIDPEAIDFEMLVDSSLTYAENKQILENVMDKPLTDKEADVMYEEFKALQEKQVREKYPELVEEWTGKIVELEREVVRGKKRLPKIKLLERKLVETERLLEEERVKPPEVAPVKIRVLKPFSEGIMDYVAGQIVQTRNLDWAMNKIEKGFAERVPVEVPVTPPPPVPKELTEEEKKKLSDLFETGLRRRLGRLPRNAMAEFRVEFETLKMLSYEKAAELIESLVRDIVEREEKIVVPRIPVAVPPPEVAVPPEFAIMPPAKRIPKTPISPLPFPRAPTSEEKEIIWENFTYELAGAGIDYGRWVRAYKERINLPFRNWDAFLKTYREFVDSILTGKPVVFIPIPARIPMPWREDTEEHRRYDAIIHLTSTGLYKTIDELIYSTEPPGLEAYGVMGVTPEEVKVAIKKAWKEKHYLFVVYPKAKLEEFIGESLPPYGEN